MYRFHTKDEIFFREDIKVIVQTMGGDFWRKIKAFPQDAKYIIASSGDPAEYADDSWINFFRQDHYRVVSYYYLKDLS